MNSPRAVRGQTPPGTAFARWAPSFVGIGAEKSATTWCWLTLDAHPEVGMSQPKELNYFNLNYERGPGWYREQFPRPERRIQGEISPWYMDDPRVCPRLAADCPQVRLLAVLRDPYERALSHLAMEVQNATGGVSRARPADWRRLAASDDKYVRRSLYAAGLRPYFEAFPRERITVLFYEDLKRDAGRFAAALYRAVGADPAFVPPTVGQTTNKTQDYRWPRLFFGLRRVSRACKGWGPTRGVLEAVYRRTRLREQLLDWLMVDAGRPAVQFDDVFSAADAARIAADRCRLASELGLALPATWTTDRLAA
jgi:hypothetical protein